MLFGETELAREVLANNVAVEQGHPASAALEQFDEKGVGDGRLA